MDYHSRFFEGAKLPFADTKGLTVITHIKSAFASTPQRNLNHYFARLWQFKHTTTSPRHSPANGLGEKAKQDSHDLYLALLEYRNAPINDVDSPFQLLMNRQLQSIIPTSDVLLKPKVLDAHKVMEKLELKQRKKKNYFDWQDKALPVLETGDWIRV